MIHFSFPLDGKTKENFYWDTKQCFFSSLETCAYRCHPPVVMHQVFTLQHVYCLCFPLQVSLELSFSLMASGKLHAVCWKAMPRPWVSPPVELHPARHALLGAWGQVLESCSVLRWTREIWHRSLPEKWQLSETQVGPGGCQILSSYLMRSCRKVCV